MERVHYTAIINVVVACLHLAGPVYIETTISGRAYSSMFTSNLWAEKNHEPELQRYAAFSIILTSVSLFVANNAESIEAQRPYVQKYVAVCLPWLGILHYFVAILRLAEVTHATIQDHSIVQLTVTSAISTWCIMLMPYIVIVKRVFDSKM